MDLVIKVVSVLLVCLIIFFILVFLTRKKTRHWWTHPQPLAYGTPNTKGWKEIREDSLPDWVNYVVSMDSTIDNHMAGGDAGYLNGKYWEYQLLDDGRVYRRRRRSRK